MNKLVLVDGNSILYRSFYALPALMNVDGNYTNAMYGFANMLIKIINDIKPTHICVAFDASKKTFRNQIFEAYKGTRKPMPDELRSQIEPVKQMLEKMNIKIVEKLGIEADDIIGTLSKKFVDTETIIVTGDRDSLQLISENTSVLLTVKGVSETKKMDLEAMKKEYGLTPVEFIDLKALQGDSSDNIPGVPGVGPKTALDLLQKYRNLNNIYEHLDDLKPALKAKMQTGKNLAYMSYDLSKIRCNEDLDVLLSELVYDFPFSNEVMEFMQKYKFASILKRSDLFAKNMPENTENSREVEFIDSYEKLQNVIGAIEKSDEIAFYWDENANFYFATSDHEWCATIFVNLLDSSKVAECFFDEISKIMKNPRIKKIFYNSKSMRHFLKEKDIEIVGDFEDLAILTHLCEGVSIKYIEDVIDKPKYDLKTPATSLLLKYEELVEKAKELSLLPLYYDVELPLSQILFDMECVGFKVDKNRIYELGSAYKQEIEQLTTQIYEYAGERFNLNSAKQLGEILFNKLSLPSKKNKSTSAEILEAIQNEHPIVPVILRYRKVYKLLATYIDGLLPHIDSQNLVHTCFNQTLTTTGRLSSSEPNLQNIPIRSNESREVRSIYVARDKDSVLIDADYSQIELRLLAHCTEDDLFVDAFKNNLDIHSQTACEVFGVPIESVTPEMRRIAKVVNFGVIYGISDFGLAEDLKTTISEAHNYIETFYAKHPKVKEYMNMQVEKARSEGRVCSILGRTRRMLDINSSNYLVRQRAERASQNMPLQGSAADIIKLAMIKVYNKLKEGGYKAKLIMQVHDELIIDCPNSEKREVEKIVEQSMNSAYDLKVPLVCDITSSYRWSDGH